MSRRKVKQTVTVGQCWRSPQGVSWWVAQVWRKDGLVSLVRPAPGGAHKRQVSFEELGRYTLAEPQS